MVRLEDRCFAGVRDNPSVSERIASAPVSIPDEFPGEMAGAEPVGRDISWLSYANPADSQFNLPYCVCHASCNCAEALIREDIAICGFPPWPKGMQLDAPGAYQLAVRRYGYDPNGLLLPDGFLSLVEMEVYPADEAKLERGKDEAQEDYLLTVSPLVQGHRVTSAWNDRYISKQSGYFNPLIINDNLGYHATCRMAKLYRGINRYEISVNSWVPFGFNGLFMFHRRASELTQMKDGPYGVTGLKQGWSEKSKWRKHLIPHKV